jgi:tripartite-type tricarboxylate transporter receptor subunit TctC
MLCGTSLAYAQAYPARSIRLLIPLAPGGGTDILARLLAQKLAERVGQVIIPDNRPAVDGVVATDIVAKSAPDGYTLLFVSSSHAINVAIGRKLPYDTIKDFAPITQTAAQQIVLVVHPSLPVKSVKELIEYAKAKPGTLSFGSSSSATQLPMELFNAMAGIKMVHVPYKGAAPSLNDLVAGRIEVSFSPALATLPFIQAGRLRALSIGDTRRSSALPDVPTTAEAGLPGYQATIWTGMLAPAKTAPVILNRLNAELVRIVRDPSFKEWASQHASDGVGSTADEFAKFIQVEIVKWTRIARQAGVKATD